MSWAFVTQACLSVALVCWFVALVRYGLNRSALGVAVVGFVFLVGAAVAAYQTL